MGFDEAKLEAAPYTCHFSAVWSIPWHLSLWFWLAQWWPVTFTSLVNEPGRFLTLSGTRLQSALETALLTKRHGSHSTLPQQHFSEVWRQRRWLAVLRWNLMCVCAPASFSPSYSRLRTLSFHFSQFNFLSVSGKIAKLVNTVIYLLVSGGHSFSGQWELTLPTQVKVKYINLIVSLDFKS